MSCERCRQELEEGMKFCRGCGKKLTLICPHCHERVQAGDIFCGECGGALRPTDNEPGTEPAPTDLGAGIAHPPKKGFGPQKNPDMAHLIRVLEEFKEKSDGNLSSHTPATDSWDLNHRISSPKGMFIPRHKIFLLAAVFYLILIAYVLMELVYPKSHFAQIANIFQNFWANLLVLAFFLLGIAFCIYGCIDFFHKRLLRLPWYRPKLGKILIKEGYITRENLEEALTEQRQRLGEHLVEKGHLTTEQLTDSLSLQKKLSCRLGEALKMKGHLSEEELDRALHQINRKLGEILCDRGIMTDDELELVLARQQNTDPYERAGTQPKIAL